MRIPQANQTDETNSNDVVSSLVTVATSAGRSAMQRYRRLRYRHVARRAFLAFVSLALAAAGADVASSFGTSGADGIFAGTLAAIGLAGLALAWWGPFGRAEMDRWRQGAAGEVSTAAILDAMAGRRWKVWHDLAVPTRRQNIDHLVVGPTGVWLVDSKTTRATVTRRWGRRIRVGGRPFDTSATAWEAEMVARELTAFLGEAAPVEVYPLVVLHSIGTASRARQRRLSRRAEEGGVRIVEPSKLTRHIRRGRRALSRTDIARIASGVDAAFEEASWQEGSSDEGPRRAPRAWSRA